MIGLTDEVGGASKVSASNIESISKRLLSKKELACALGVSTRTIENWLSQKRIPQLRLSARLTRFCGQLLLRDARNERARSGIGPGPARVLSAEGEISPKAVRPGPEGSS